MTVPLRALCYQHESFPRLACEWLGGLGCHAGYGALRMIPLPHGSHMCLICRVHEDRETVKLMINECSNHKR